MRQIVWSSCSGHENLAVTSLMMLSNIKDLKAKEKDIVNVIYNANCCLLNEARSKLNVLVTGNILKIETAISGDKRDICVKLLNTYNLSNCMVSMYKKVEWFIDIDEGFKSIESTNDGYIYSEYRVLNDGVTIIDIIKELEKGDMSFPEIISSTTGRLGTLVRALLAE